MTLVPASLAGRLLFGALAVTGVAIVAVGLIVGAVLDRFIRGQIDGRLDTEIVAIAAALGPGAGGAPGLLRTADGPPFDRPLSGWYWTVTGPGLDERSASLAGRGFTAIAGPPGWREILAGRPVPADGIGPRREPLYIRTAHRSVAGVPVSIAVTAPVDALAGPMRAVMVPLAIALAALLAILAAATVLQVRLGLRPIERMRTAVARVRAGAAGEVPVDVPAELQPLAAELNTLLRQNAAGLERARRHVANLAHGLKTPLATLALALDQQGSDGAGELHRLVEEINRRMRHHLRRARSAALAEGPARSATDVLSRIEGLALVLRRVHADRPVRFDVAASASAAVACEPEDVDEMLGNLLDNGFKWARSRVTAGVLQDGRQVTVTVDDDGPGLADDVLPEAVLPGRRLDETVPGDGFGLSITRELAELYGGSLVLDRSPLGGLRAAVTLPATPMEPV